MDDRRCGAGFFFGLTTWCIGVAIFLAMPRSENKKLFQTFLAQIRRIPRGKVATYGDVAYAAGYPGYARQVAWALHGGGGSVPWQRVVGSGGRILLTGEHGFEQRMRLQGEGVRLIGLRVDMKAHHHSFFGKKAAKKTLSGVKRKTLSAKKSARSATASQPSAPRRNSSGTRRKGD